MRSSATGCVGLQQRQGTFVRGLSRHAIAIDKRATIAVQLTNPDLSPRQMPARSSAGIVRESEHAGILSADGPATLAAPFRPLDPGIVNEAIPVFFIGIGASAHQAWSANIFTTVSDMFPKKAVGTVTGIGGLAGGIGGVVISKIGGWIFDAYDKVGHIQTGYTIMFAICLVAYLIAWLIMKSLVPRYKLVTDL